MIVQKCQTTFQELVQQLEDEHNREIAELQSETAQLRSENARLRKVMKEKTLCLGDGSEWDNKSLPQSLPTSEIVCDFSEACEMFLLGEQNPIRDPLRGSIMVSRASTTPTPDAQDVNNNFDTGVMCGPNSLRANVSDMRKNFGILLGLKTDDPEFLLRSTFQMWSKICKMMRQPLNFSLRPTWVHGEATLATPDYGRRTESMVVPPVELINVQSELRIDDQEAPGDGCSKYIIVHPCSTARVAWDLMGATLLFIDMVFIPLQAFGIQRTLAINLIDWVILIFWTLDMFVSCITGYVDKGQSVMKPTRIVWHYLKTWFLLDMLVVGPDWILNILELIGQQTNEGDDTGSGSRLLRTLRAVRVARLLRVVKLKRIVAMIRDRIDSENTFIVVNVLKLLMMLLLVNHFLAAVWYGIGDLGIGLGTPNWIESEIGFMEEPLGYRYTTSLHWSLTQFTPASMSVQPQNVVERTFAIAVLLFGLVLFSSFISNITASMTQLRSMEDDKSKQFWLLRRYLRQHGVQGQLGFRILRYVDYACREEDLVSRSRIWVLDHLSEQLRSELHYVVSFSCLMSHPLFERTSSMSGPTMHRLTQCALSQQSFALRDILFHCGTCAGQMYIVVSGEIYYYKVEDETSTTMKKDDWLCEQALWTQWTHFGDARATTECEIVSIDVVTFEESIRKEALVWQVVSVYAQNFVQWLNEKSFSSLTDAFPFEHCKGNAACFIERGESVRRSNSVKYFMGAVWNGHVH